MFQSKSKLKKVSVLCLSLVLSSVSLFPARQVCAQQVIGMVQPTSISGIPTEMTVGDKGTMEIVWPATDAGVEYGDPVIQVNPYTGKDLFPDYVSDEEEHLKINADGTWEAISPGIVEVGIHRNAVSEGSDDEQVVPVSDTSASDGSGVDTYKYLLIVIKGTDQIVYRLYNPNSGEHFYTKDANEKKYLVSIGWKDEGVAWTTPGQYTTKETPVYRLYNPNSGEHHYTSNANESKYLESIGWKDEGIAWYSAEEETTPLYRLYNPNAVGKYEAGAHHYTSDANEVEELVRLGWKSEGIGWYGK